MANRIKRITALVIALAMCLSLFCANVWAAEEAPDDGSVSAQSSEEAAQEEETPAEKPAPEEEETPAEESASEEEEAPTVETDEKDVPAEAAGTSGEQSNQSASESEIPAEEPAPEEEETPAEESASEEEEAPTVESDEKDVPAEAAGTSGEQSNQSASESEIPAEEEARLAPQSGTYEISYWTTPLKCHVFSNEDGSTTVIYSVNRDKLKMCIRQISATGDDLSYQEVVVPGLRWGGCVYHAPDGNWYVATGDGIGEDKEIAYFFTKFNSNWTLLGTAKIGRNESETASPYDAGNCDMVMTGNYLVVHAARGRMDGHQSNTTFYIDTNTMQPAYVVGVQGYDHVSHSFNQFIRIIGDKVVEVDQGDAYPRGIVLQAFPAGESPDCFLNHREQTRKILFSFHGKIGQNYTGATVDGFEEGEDYHLVAGTSIPHDKFKDDKEFEEYEGGRNIYLILVSKDLESSKLLWLTDYQNVNIDYLKLIKNNKNDFILLYGLSSEDGLESDKTCYIRCDSSGNIISQGSLEERSFCTSEAIFKDDTITWFHYLESEYGVFLVRCSWNIATGMMNSQNLPISESTKITKVSDLYIDTSDGSFGFISDNKGIHLKTGVNYTIGVDVSSRICDDIDLIDAPVLWTSSNPGVIRIQKNHTLLSYRYSIGGKLDGGKLDFSYSSTGIEALKEGSSEITCTIGNQTVKCQFIVEKLNSTEIIRLKSEGTDSVSVEWQKQTVDGYQLEVSQDKSFKKGSKKFNIHGGDNTSVTIRNLKNSKKYFIRIRTTLIRTTNSYYCSQWSKVQAFTVGTNNLPIIEEDKEEEKPQKPNLTEIIRLKSEGKNRVSVKWKKQTVDGYQLEVSQDKSFKKGSKKYNIYGGDITSATIKNLKYSKKYFIRIRTTNSYGWSRWSRVKTITVGANYLPTAVLSSVRSIKGKKIAVKWKKIPEGKGYQIQYSSDKQFKKDVKSKTINKVNTTSLTLKGLTTGKRYYIRIRTVKGKKHSNWSKVKTVKIKK